MALATLEIPSSAAVYDAALEGLTRVDEIQIARGQVPPSPYGRGVRYRTEPRERWRTAQSVDLSGAGDCEDLAGWRSAGLRVTGEDPTARIKTYRTGPSRFHAIVERNGGTLWEDPSRKLGMRVSPKREALYLQGSHFMAPMREANGNGATLGAFDCVDCVVGEDPTPDEVANITFGVMRLPGRQGFTGWVRIPVGAGQALLARTGPVGPSVASTPTEAKQLAAKGILDIAAQIAKDPSVAAKLPADAKKALTMANIGEKGARLIADNPEALAAMGPYGKIAATALQVPGVKELFVKGGALGDKITTGTLGKIPGLKRFF